jgi:hypothetical protein
MMQMPGTCASTCNADMERSAFQSDSKIAGNNANQNFNQCDRNSRSD